MGTLLLATSVFTILQMSIILSLVQIVVWPLDWIDLRWLRQRISGFFAQSLGVCFMFWLEYMTSTKIIITGDELPPNERVLVVSNHIAVEWMHLISLVHRHTQVSGFKAVMKESLKYVPIANVGIREGFVTVKRGQGKNARGAILESFRRQGEQLCTDHVPMWLIIFPEGTWITPKDTKIKDKANDFARKQGYPDLHNVLFPRANGFCALLEGMRKGPDAIDAVYDVTVAYNKPYHPVKIGTSNPPTVVQLTSSAPNAPKEVHFHITRHLTRDIPSRTEDVSKWLCKRFAVEKENLLNEFEKNKSFPGVDRSKPLYLPSLMLHNIFMGTNIILFYIGMHTLMGKYAVSIFLGLGVFAAIAAATGDKKNEGIDKDKQK
jgi:lysocardiolipin and lysophospholipid acyltransferase